MNLDDEIGSGIHWSSLTVRTSVQERRCRNVSGVYEKYESNGKMKTFFSEETTVHSKLFSVNNEIFVNLYQGVKQIFVTSFFYMSQYRQNNALFAIWF